MEDRIELKEKRILILWLIFFAIYPTILTTVGIVYGEDWFKCTIFIVPLLFLVYKVITYLFNSLLLVFFRRKTKIDRLKGRVTPIYKLSSPSYDNTIFHIKKYSVKYTNLDLKCSIPFSVLFQEQEYVFKGHYFTTKIPDDLAEF